MVGQKEYQRTFKFLAKTNDTLTKRNRYAVTIFNNELDNNNASSMKIRESKRYRTGVKGFLRSSTQCVFVKYNIFLTI